mgnify:CR=1 FL=1
MTVGDKMHKLLSSLRNAQADLEAFSMDTQDKNAKQLFADSSEQLNQIINNVADRTNYLEQEEPQYNMNPNKQPDKK